MNYRNFTPHTINLNDGRKFESEGIARVSSEFTEVLEDLCFVEFGEVTGLPDPQPKTRIIVSALVMQVASDRKDLVAPATGHPETIRNEKGHIVSVPGFIAQK